MPKILINVNNTNRFRRGGTDLQKCKIVRMKESLYLCTCETEVLRNSTIFERVCAYYS